MRIFLAGQKALITRRGWCAEASTAWDPRWAWGEARLGVVDARRPTSTSSVVKAASFGAAPQEHQLLFVWAAGPLSRPHRGQDPFTKPLGGNRCSSTSSSPSASIRAMKPCSAARSVTGPISMVSVVASPAVSGWSACSTAGVSRPVTRKLYSAFTSFSLPIGASAPVQAPPGTLSERWGERFSSSEHERDGDGRLDAFDSPGSVDSRFAVPLATNVVVRPRLLDQLTTAPASCVLIAAPAGWGKTLLASSWLAEGATDNDAAWISLSPTDDDLRGFWTSVAAALIPRVGDRAAAALRNAVADDELEQVPGKVAAALAADGAPLVLVLDNLHEVTGLAVHESLLRLVQRPPRGLRMVVTTRRDPPWPLSQLRLAGVLSEIRASDLAFRADETRALLDRLGIDLDAVHVGRLVARTGGWAAGLRLAALELHNTPDPAGFVDGFSGDDHAVAAYLLDQVIDRLSPALLDFLVRVSILDVVSADLADAMTGGSGGRGTLAELARSNLFVQAVGASGRWYRLHRLIADVLRTRITRPRTVRDLHRRAVEWHLHQAMPLEALRYALRGGLWPLAAELLGVHVLALTVRGNPREIDMLLTAVPREVLLSHPELAAALAAARIHHGSPTASGSWPPRPRRARTTSRAHAQSGSASS